MKIDDVVFQDYQGIRRYGVIKKVEIKEDGWSYAGIDWVSDDKYISAMAHLKLLRGTDLSKTEYRTDEVRVINAGKEIRTLKACLRRAEVAQ